LVCDAGGTLHLTYRRCHKGTLDYCRRPAGGTWSTPRVLVRQVKPGYVNWTNALAIGPDGRLHLVFSNTRPQPDGGLYIGASYLYSTDGGESWRQPGQAEPVELPASVDALRLIEGPAPDPSRIVPAERVAGDGQGPLSVQLHQLNLSNPVAGAAGRPWVVAHNVLAGEADLWCLTDDTWRAVPLAPAVRECLPGHRIHAQSTLSRRADGSLEAVLMVAPEDSPGWGPAGTSLVRIRFDDAGAVRSVEPVCPARADMATWLPSLERWSWRAPLDAPALLYTQGLVGSWSPKHNSLINDVETSVFLDLP
ncbi:MAG TPA: sialidase family protein, partial [Phycisphaerae bacterium]|nr:sialidase family protein [Phycisphaerae bacterium]